MKIKILRPYLDYEVGKSYDIENPALANYMVAMSVGKKVVSKDGEPDDTEKTPVKKEKKHVKPTAKKDNVTPASDSDDLS